MRGRGSVVDSDKGPSDVVVASEVTASVERWNLVVASDNPILFAHLAYRQVSESLRPFSELVVRTNSPFRRRTPYTP